VNSLKEAQDRCIEERERRERKKKRKNKGKEESRRGRRSQKGRDDVEERKKEEERKKKDVATIYAQMSDRRNGLRGHSIRYQIRPRSG
jgi:hypothetical protein